MKRLENIYLYNDYSTPSPEDLLALIQEDGVEKITIHKPRKNENMYISYEFKCTPLMSRRLRNLFESGEYKLVHFAGRSQPYVLSKIYHDINPDQFRGKNPSKEYAYH